MNFELSWNVSASRRLVGLRTINGVGGRFPHFSVVVLVFFSLMILFVRHPLNLDEFLQHDVFSCPINDLGYHPRLLDRGA